MDRLFENGAITVVEPGFSNVQDFFMARNPGAIGIMLGNRTDLELPTPVFLDALEAGLSSGDAAALRFRYKSISDLIGARNVTVWYDRDGCPMVEMSGDAFPNTHVSLDMAFLKNGKMAWSGYVFSDRFLLPFWKNWELEKLHKGDSAIKLDTSGFYPQHADSRDISIQVSKYPDLDKALTEFHLATDDPLTEEIRDIVATWNGHWSGHTDIQQTGHQKQVMENYSVTRYLAELHSFVPTLNQIVEETQTLVPIMQNTYSVAKDFLY